MWETKKKKERKKLVSFLHSNVSLPFSGDPISRRLGRHNCCRISTYLAPSLFYRSPNEEICFNSPRGLVVEERRKYLSRHLFRRRWCPVLSDSA